MRNLEMIIRVSIAIAALILAGTAALAALCGGAIPLPNDETCAQCARAWISATSGWAAAIAAFVTIVVLVRANLIQIGIHNSRLLENLRADVNIAKTVISDFDLVINDIQKINSMVAEGKEISKRFYTIIRVHKTNIRKEYNPHIFRLIELGWEAVSSLHDRGVREEDLLTHIVEADIPELESRIAQIRDLQSEIRKLAIEPFAPLLNKPAV